MTVHTPQMIRDAALADARRIARIASEDCLVVTVPTMRRAAEVLARSGSPMDWERAKKLKRAIWRARLLDPTLLLMGVIVVWGVAMISLLVGGLN